MALPSHMILPQRLLIAKNAMNRAQLLGLVHILMTGSPAMNSVEKQS
jgi:hypothetical protein